ncbi:MAG: hypothetical protein HZB55_02455 [Deltaproteobacteria bacterium]|nr:hypothetical protein [Deltaproteobacteria bacterium]
MPDAVPPPRPRRRRLRLLGAALLAAGLGSAALISFLPTLASTDAARRVLEKAASQSLRRPVHVGRVHWRWRTGLVVEGLRLDDEPAFSPEPLAALQRVELRVGWRRLLERTLAVELTAEGLWAGYVRTTTGATNWGAFLQNLPPSPPKPPREGPVTLPIEVTARLRVSGIELSADDRRSGRRAAVHGGTVALGVPSLRSAPVTLSVAGRAEADGRPLSPLSVTAEVAHAFDGRGVLAPLAASARASAGLPGARLGLTADLPTGVVTARFDVDLGPFVEAFGPFLPSAASPAAASGTLSLAADAQGDPKQSLGFHVILSGNGVRASGGALGADAVGPLRLALEARGRAEPAVPRVTVEAGEVRVQERSRLGWTATYWGGRAGTRLAAEAAPVALDLGELLALSKPVAAALRPLELGGATLGAERIAWAGGSAGGPSPVEVQGLHLRVSSLGHRGGDRTVRGSRLAVDVPRLAARLERGVPTSADVKASLRLGSLRVSGPGGFSAEGLELSGLRAEARGLARRPDGAFGLTGRVSLEESLSLARAAAGPGASVAGLRHALKAAVVLQPGRSVNVQVTRLDAAAASATYRDRGRTVTLGGGGKGRGQAAALRLAGARFSGPLRGGINPVGAERLEVVLPVVAASGGASPFSARGLRLTVRDAVCVLRQGFPESLGLSASLDLGAAQVEGARRLRVSGLALSRASVAGSDLVRSPEAPLGVSGRLALRQALSLDGVWVAGSGEARAVRQELDVDGRLGAQPHAQLRRFRLDAEAVTIDDPQAGRRSLPLHLDAAADGLTLRGTAPLRADVRGARLRLGAGPLINVDLTSSLEDLGRASLVTSGRLDADLSRLPPRLAELARAGLRVGGVVGFTWDVAGRLPTEAETGALRTVQQEAESLPFPLAFAGRADAALTLAGVSVHAPLEKGQSLSLAGVSTRRPLRVSVGPGGARARLDGALVAEVVEEVPGLAPFDLPPRASLELTAEQEGQRGVKVSETLEVDLLGLRQTLVADVAGLDRALRRGLLRPTPLWLKNLDGVVRVGLQAGKNVGAVRLGRDLSWDGPLAASAEVRLRRERDVEARVAVDSTGLDARVGDLLAVRGLRSHLLLEKRYTLAATDERGTVPPAPRFLSQTVLEPPEAETAGRGGDEGHLRPLSEELARQFRGAPSLAFDRVSFRSGARRIELERGSMDLRLVDGRPVLDRLQLDLLGGSATGSVSLGPEGEGFPLRVRLAVSGLDPGRLVPELAGSASAEGAVTARAVVEAPLSRGAEGLLSEVDLRVDLTRIGRRALDRLLYALDPTGGNESLAKQRRLLQTATPRWVTVGIRRGNLSLAGELDVKGVRLAIPPVDRLNVAELPVRERVDRALARAGPLLEWVRILAAPALEVGPAGRVQVATASSKAPGPTPAR